MPIRQRPELDMTHPPGQAFRYPKYLRDEIARIEGEEGKPVATFNVKEATQVSPDAEKRLEGLVAALLYHCDLYEGNAGYLEEATLTTTEIRSIIREHL